MNEQLKVGGRIRSLVSWESSEWAPEQPDLPRGTPGTVIGKHLRPNGNVIDYTVLLDGFVDPLPVGMRQGDLEPVTDETPQQLEGALAGLMERFRDDTNIPRQLFGEDILAAAEVLNARCEFLFIQEQVRAAVDSLRDQWSTAMAALAPAAETAAKQLREAFQEVVKVLEQADTPALHSNDRPAWQSPYGPPQRRR